jgi:hypothetical protein
MRISLQLRMVLGLVILTVALYFGLESHPVTGSSMLFQSQLQPPPRPTDNPHAVKSDVGGRIYCGLAQSSAWLDIPKGFTTDWGAEIRCDLARPLSSYRNSTGAMSDRGYLVGIYPSSVPIVRPLSLILEVNPADVPNACQNCLAARYYDPGRNQWQDLPGNYNPSQGRVIAEIPRQLIAARYPGYEDRVLAAVFIIRSVNVPTATYISVSTSTPPTTGPIATPTPRLTITNTVKPATALTLTTTLTPMRTSTPTSLPTAVPQSTASPTSPALIEIKASPSMPAPATPSVTQPLIATAEPVLPPPGQPNDSIVTVLLGTIAVLGIAIVALLSVLVIQAQRQKRSRD